MKPKPYISVIIVCYNYENYLPRALQACKKQTFKNFELILVNNGSTDNSSLIMNEFQKTNPNLKIKIINIKKNNGLVNGRNKGLDAARGKYVLFNDADDWMEKKCLQILANTAEKTNADRITGSFRDIDINNKEMQIRNFPKNTSTFLNGMLQASIYKREIFTKNNIHFPEKGYDDQAINLLFNIKSSKFIFINKVIYNYFVNINSTSGSKTVKNSGKLIIKLFKEHAELCKNHIKLTNKKNQILIEYQLIKMYYYNILHINRYSSIKNMLHGYQLLNYEMKRLYPNYLNNTNITILKDNGERNYGKYITWSLTHLEKYHLMKLSLIIYSIISKFFYFQV